MKKLIAICLLVLTVLTGCGGKMKNRGEITALYRAHAPIFAAAAETGDFSAVRALRGVESVYISETYVDIFCIGEGYGSSTHYYGIFYSPADDMCAIDLAYPRGELKPDGDGYSWSEPGGDNSYYVEPLGGQFYYYEAHF